MKRRRIAIIGAGFSGAAVAAQLLKRRGRGAPNVVLIERNRRFGPGLAYGGTERGHLLNVRASNMSAFPDQPDHFARWLSRRLGGEQAAVFAPRPSYGAYAEHVLNSASTSAWGRLKRIRSEATACRRTDEAWEIDLRDGPSISADAVVLAMGNAPSMTPPVFQSNGIPVLDAWDARAVKPVARGASVLMLGVGLTMIDLALTLARDSRIGVIYALSRRGLAPRTHLKTGAPPTPEALALPPELSDALHVFRREVRAIALRGEPWQYAVDRLRARTPDIWKRLTPEQQRRFLRHLRPWWDVHRHRCAPEIGARLAELQSTGKLKILAGEIVDAQRIKQGFELHHRQRGGLARRRMEVVRVINCTGSSNDIASGDSPLLQQLLTDGLVRAPACGLGLEVDVDGRLVDASGKAHRDMATLGPLTQGAFWESTAVPEIRIWAARLADLLAPHA